MLIPLRQICSPSLPEKMDCPLRLKSASNACPIASCRRIPDAPAPITTGIRPPFGRLASNLASMPLTARLTMSSIRLSSIISGPLRRLLDTLLSSVLSPCLKMVCTETLPNGRESDVSSPRELYIIISLMLYERDATTLMTRLSLCLIPLSILFRKGINPLMQAFLQSSLAL